MKRIALVIPIIGIVLLSACVVTTPQSSPTAPTPEEPETQITELTAEQLYLAYKASQANADIQFKGKTIKVTGAVQSMGQDAAGTAYTMLTSSETDQTQMVKCLFSKGYRGEMMGITNGDIVTIQGIGFGYAEYPIITDCKLLEKK